MNPSEVVEEQKKFALAGEHLRQMLKSPLKGLGLSKETEILLANMTIQTVGRLVEFQKALKRQRGLPAPLGESEHPLGQREYDEIARFVADRLVDVVVFATK